MKFVIFGLFLLQLNYNTFSQIIVPIERLDDKISIKPKKMNNEYVIINKTAIQKRIEELKPTLIISDKNEKEIIILEQILSQSTPLIPEIEKAFDAGSSDKIGQRIFGISSNEYISNLKLDI